MKVEKITIDAKTVAGQVSETITTPLAKVDCHRLPIVEVLPDGSIDIIDGYHRIAGMIAAGETEIDCLTCDDADALGCAANAERPGEQSAALDKIYAASN